MHSEGGEGAYEVVLAHWLLLNRGRGDEAQSEYRESIGLVELLKE